MKKQAPPTFQSLYNFFGKFSHSGKQFVREIMFGIDYEGWTNVQNGRGAVKFASILAGWRAIQKSPIAVPVLDLVNFQNL